MNTFIKQRPVSTKNLTYHQAITVQKFDISSGHNSTEI